LSVNFQFKDALKANAYGANYILRRRGINLRRRGSPNGWTPLSPLPSLREYGP